MGVLHQPFSRGVEPRLSIGERVAATRLRVRQLGRTVLTSIDQPCADTDLVIACSDLLRIDAAINIVLASDDRDALDVPGYAGLEEERARVLSIIEQSRAVGLPGLQAKAQVLLSRRLRDDFQTTADIVHSLALDLMNSPRLPQDAAPDPIFAVIETGARLEEEARLLQLEAADLPEADPACVSAVEARTAMWKHINDVILRTTPTTIAGGIALADFAVDFSDRQGVPVARDEEAIDLLRLIAASGRQ